MVAATRRERRVIEGLGVRTYNDENISQQGFNIDASSGDIWTEMRRREPATRPMGFVAEYDDGEIAVYVSSADVAPVDQMVAWETACRIVVAPSGANWHHLEGFRYTLIVVGEPAPMALLAEASA
jgi:hypothetical protein